MALPVYDFDPRNLPQELLAAIGLAITSAAQTENIVEQAIAGCAGVDFEFGKAITTHMSMPLRFSVLTSVAEIRINSLDVLDELDKQLELIDAALSKRNQIAHYQFCRDPKTDQIYAVKQVARTRLESELIPVAIDQVKADALLIYEVGVAFYQFLTLNELLPSFPVTPRPRQHKSKAARKKRRQAS